MNTRPWCRNCRYGSRVVPPLLPYLGRGDEGYMWPASRVGHDCALVLFTLLFAAATRLSAPFAHCTPRRRLVLATRSKLQAQRPTKHACYARKPSACLQPRGVPSRTSLGRLCRIPTPFDTSLTNLTDNVLTDCEQSRWAPGVPGVHQAFPPPGLGNGHGLRRTALTATREVQPAEPELDRPRSVWVRIGNRCGRAVLPCCRCLVWKRTPTDVFSRAPSLALCQMSWRTSHPTSTACHCSSCQ